MTAIEIPDYVTVVKPGSISDLAQAASTLLADNGDLPAPSYFTVSLGGRALSGSASRTALSPSRLSPSGPNASAAP